MDVTPGSTAIESSGGGGFRARLRRKLAAAKKLRPRLRMLERDAKGQYSTARDTIDIEAERKRELSGSGFEDFDERLRNQTKGKR